MIGQMWISHLRGRAHSQCNPAARREERKTTARKMKYDFISVTGWFFETKK
jgi:hypothetical protein